VLLEFKDVAATQLQRIHTPESYAVDFQPMCDGGGVDWMHAINISRKFILSFVHSVVSLDYHPRKWHTWILARPRDHDAAVRQ
jgi:hypothetical protein